MASPGHNGAVAMLLSLWLHATALWCHAVWICIVMSHNAWMGYEYSLPSLNYPRGIHKQWGMCDKGSNSLISFFQNIVKEITELRKVAFDAENEPTPPSGRRQSHAKDYKKLGFQNHINPVEDFNHIPPGILALDCMVYFAKVYGEVYTKVCFFLKSLRAKFFRGNINIYLHFMSLLQIDIWHRYLKSFLK